MNRMKTPRFLWTDAALLIISLVFFAGMLTFLGACGPKDDGSWMTCHWAGQTLRGTACALAVLSILRFFFRDGVRIGLDLGSMVIAALSIAVPGKLIGLCMMETMRCRAVMTPGATILSCAVIAAAGIDIFRRVRREQKA